ncbi:Os03g0589100 [Oryza sativa Japonica Group]|uniref:Os03g0589100 protein n=2 Tax=Oryza sativa subsp. japonica TaxID=39947 RepID=A3AK12_ORYSJ|nr:hypothetical protein [Oryza sativa Japonica Group]KAB8092516.1 hypothetical protein EE612_018690 [Oryza sativa]ABF97377.1 hypothetical protein LOC_Os03g39220 [Oryza sativa Japonica Group]EAZ27651.1 hypothetical protein OsJ_11596 [Oryza sativa Japonica Group]KAF2940084.1 hypothetical protein DAI22_03g244100 [Oryza sativa Japonica Group]|eukprot:NP_001173515.1 Os03g0589100 [Oryza sativa Japonica Group]
MADDMPPAVDDDLQELIDELMEDDAEDREHEEISATALSEATEYLVDPDPPSPEQVGWAEGAVISAQSAADNMASYVLDLRRALAVFAGTGRPEEAVLRKHVAWADARRAEAVEIASAARRLLEKELRCMAARDHPVIPELAALITAMRVSTKSLVLQDSGGDAVRSRKAGLLASAIKFEDAVVEKMTVLKEKLTRGAAAFAGEGEIVQALQKHAATAEAEIAESQAFSAVLLADANRAASPVVVVHKRPTPETEKEQDQEPPRQRRRTGDSAAQD